MGEKRRKKVEKEKAGQKENKERERKVVAARFRTQARPRITEVKKKREKRVAPMELNPGDMLRIMNGEQLLF